MVGTSLIWLFIHAYMHALASTRTYSTASEPHRSYERQTHHFVTSQLASSMASAPSYCRWSTRRYILAALAGTLIATFVITVVSAVLKPAEIHFSVTSSNSTPTRSGESLNLNLTITANNTSQRAGVQYRNVIVSLQYILEELPQSIPLDNISVSSLCQSPRETISINVSSTLLVKDVGRKGSHGTTNPISVLVNSVVRFKYGRAYTRPYDIRVLCAPVGYLSGSRLSLSLPVNCSEA